MAGFTADDLAALGSGPVDAGALDKIVIEYADAVIESTPGVDAGVMYGHAFGM